MDTLKLFTRMLNFKRMLVISVICFLVICPLARAGQDVDALNTMRHQAHEEQLREEEIQMMRLELEKLKLEVETRKTMAEIGPMITDPTIPSSKVNIEVKNILIIPAGSSAIIDAGGLRQLVHEGESVGPFKIKRINTSGLILIDDKGLEHLFEVHS